MSTPSFNGGSGNPTSGGIVGFCLFWLGVLIVLIICIALVAYLAK